MRILSNNIYMETYAYVERRYNYIYILLNNILILTTQSLLVSFNFISEYNY